MTHEIGLTNTTQTKTVTNSNLCRRDATSAINKTFVLTPSFCTTLHQVLARRQIKSITLEDLFAFQSAYIHLQPLQTNKCCCVIKTTI